jgi:hypothetical protein
MCIDQAWLNARILATQAEIEAMEILLEQLTASGGMITYTLDTGQSRQVVTKMDSKRAGSYLDSLYNRLAILCARKNGSNSFTARPAW